RQRRGKSVGAPRSNTVTAGYGSSDYLAVTTLHCENSEVLFPASVAVAVMYSLGLTTALKLTANVAFPELSVLTTCLPRNLSPSPYPEGLSHAVLAKYSIVKLGVKLVLAVLLRLPPILIAPELL